MNPDGDADLTDEQVGDFTVVPCVVCGGVLKPDVVFFGEAVPPERVERCRALVRGADALLVLGSSLTVMSGLRFVRQAADAGTPVLIVNRDATRGDRHAVTRVALPLGQALTAAAYSVCPSLTARRPDTGPGRPRGTSAGPPDTVGRPRLAVTLRAQSITGIDAYG